MRLSSSSCGGPRGRGSNRESRRVATVLTGFEGKQKSSASDLRNVPYYRALDPECCRIIHTSLKRYRDSLIIGENRREAASFLGLRDFYETHCRAAREGHGGSGKILASCHHLCFIRGIFFIRLVVLYLT